MSKVEEVTKIIGDLYNDISSYSLHAKGKVELGGKHGKIIYGEMPVETLGEIFKEVGFKEGNFYDLGSGTGHLVLGASMLLNHPSKCVGVELLKNMHEVALDKKAKFEGIVKEGKRCKVEFVNGDMFEYDFSDADFIVLNFPSQSEDFFGTELEKRFEKLKPGTKIVTIIAYLRDNFDNVVKKITSKQYEFSWGKSTAHFYERR